MAKNSESKNIKRKTPFIFATGLGIGKSGDGLFIDVISQIGEDEPEAVFSFVLNNKTAEPLKKSLDEFFASKK